MAAEAAIFQGLGNASRRQRLAAMARESVLRTRIEGTGFTRGKIRIAWGGEGLNVWSENL
jgi:hypothetical protein